VTQIAPHSATVHLAIELSRSAWLVAARLPGVEKPSLHQIEGGDTATLLALVETLAVPAGGQATAGVGERKLTDRDRRQACSGWAFASATVDPGPMGCHVGSICLRRAEILIRG
jgi:hypothetical protein